MKMDKNRLKWIKIAKMAKTVKIPKIAKTVKIAKNGQKCLKKVRTAKNY